MMKFTITIGLNDLRPSPRVVLSDGITEIVGELVHVLPPDEDLLPV